MSYKLLRHAALPISPFCVRGEGVLRWEGDLLMFAVAGLTGRSAGFLSI